MAVRESLLGLLTLGPAYGLQLHAELGSRAPHRAKTNVGQVYGTLDRLTTAGLVSHHGLTSDGLPLYALTAAGMNEAQRWLHGQDLSTIPEWADLQDMVLISSSVSSDAAAALVNKVMSLTAPTRPSENTTAASALHRRAQQRYIEAVHSWIGDVRDERMQPQAGYALGRPKRGRPAKT